MILFDNVEGDIRVRDNLVQNNDANVALYNSDDGVFEDNTVLDAVFYGLYADADSAGNRFLDNTALRNTEHDCHDDEAHPAITCERGRRPARRSRRS